MCEKDETKEEEEEIDIEREQERVCVYVCVNKWIVQNGKQWSSWMTLNDRRRYFAFFVRACVFFFYSYSC